MFNPPKHALSLGHKTWFYAEGEAFKLNGGFSCFCPKIRKNRFFSIRMILENFLDLVADDIAISCHKKAIIVSLRAD